MRAKLLEAEERARSAVAEAEQARSTSQREAASEAEGKRQVYPKTATLCGVW